ncbi:unnamed protein product, partial [Cyprideis torosa]
MAGTSDVTVSSPPASSSRTLWFGFSDNLAATVAPADPPPTEEEPCQKNHIEMAESELANKKKQAEDLEEEVKTLQVSGDKLQELYSEQDDVLGRIFGGDYGSPMENRLEAE